MKAKILMAVAIAAGALSAQAQWADSIPERAIILTGDPSHPYHLQTLAEMFNQTNTAFQDPGAPRFLFLDKKGTVALGIGGYMKASAMYDFDGSVDNNDFITNMIPVPMDPAQHSRFGATAANSTIFLKLVTRSTPLGRVVVYLQTNFTGDNGNYGMALKQAWARVGHVTMGKARTTFADAPAMAPTIDDQGPSGQVGGKNMLVQYLSPSYKGFQWAISAELPHADYTEGRRTQAIAQRMPDVPAYIQYSWNKEQSHIRFSAIYRGLSYRDLATDENKIANGWGVQASAVSNIAGGLVFFGHYTYGRGIAWYINDLSGEGYDLIPDAEGRLKAGKCAGWTAGLQYNFSSKFFISSSYSRARLYGASELGPDTYKYGQYIAANAFYNPWEDLQVGVEYLHGTRNDYSRAHGHANRLELMLQYNF